MAKKPWWLAALSGDPILAGISYLLFGGNGTDPEVAKRTQEQAEAGMSPGDRYAPDKSGIQGPPFWMNWLKTQTGSGLNQAQIEQNQYNSFEAQKQRDWEADMYARRNQIAVEDMQKAGLNVGLMYGGGFNAGSAPSGAAASSNPSANVAPLESVLNALFAVQRFKQTKAEIANLEAQKANIESQTANTEADTLKKKAEEENIRKATSWMDRVNQAEVDSKNAAANLDRERVSEIFAKVRLAEKQADTEETKQLLNNANAWQIVEMTPYMKLAEQSQASKNYADAKLAAVSAAYQNGLISAGIIEATVRKTNADASDTETRAEVNKVEKLLKEYQHNVNHGNISAIAGESDTVVGGLFSVLKIGLDLVDMY